MLNTTVKDIMCIFLNKRGFLLFRCCRIHQPPTSVSCTMQEGLKSHHAKVCSHKIHDLPRQGEVLYDWTKNRCSSSWHYLNNRFGWSVWCIANSQDPLRVHHSTSVVLQRIITLTIGRMLICSTSLLSTHCYTSRYTDTARPSAYWYIIIIISWGILSKC